MVPSRRHHRRRPICLFDCEHEKQLSFHYSEIDFIPQSRARRTRTPSPQQFNCFSQSKSIKALAREERQQTPVGRHYQWRPGEPFGLADKRRARAESF